MVRPAMTAPRLVSAWFGPEKYARLAHVLRYTAERHCSDWSVEIERIDPNEFETSKFARLGHIWNVQKFEHWCRTVAAAADGDRLLLIDADCFFTNPISDVWDHEFDLAYTKRTGSRYPMNGGVLFLRVGPAVREFFARWWDLNIRMLGDAAQHRPWQKKYAGINQASFGALFEGDGMDGLNVLALPCEEWNCEDSAWTKFDPARTRIVHAKSALRWAIFPQGAPYQYRHPGRHLRPLISLWKSLEAEALEQEAAA